MFESIKNWFIWLWNKSEVRDTARKAAYLLIAEEMRKRRDIDLAEALHKSKPELARDVMREISREHPELVFLFRARIRGIVDEILETEIQRAA